MQSANWIASVSLLPVPLPGLFEDPQAVVANAQLIATAAMTTFRMAAEHTDRLVTERLRPYPSRSPDSAPISIGSYSPQPWSLLIVGIPVGAAIAIAPRAIKVARGRDERDVQRPAHALPFRALERRR